MANEKRLIDADDLLLSIRAKLLKAKCEYSDSEIICIMMDGFNALVSSEIKRAKTVDAVEVVHGEWEIIEDDYFDLVELKCSVCGASYGFEDYEDDTPKNYHYCPNCGAKMDGDGNA